MGLLENRMPVLSFPKFARPKSLAAKCGRIFFNRRVGAQEEYLGNQYQGCSL